MTIPWRDRFPARLSLSEPSIRRGVRAVYRMALEAEAASANGERKRLEEWRRWLAEGAQGAAPEPAPAEASAALRAAGLDLSGLEDLAAAWRDDAERKSVSSWAELQDHARAAYGTAGRLALHLAGTSAEDTLALAETLWAARGLTAILQDTRAWVERGRIYLPADAMAEHGYSEADLRMGVVNDRFRAVMKDLWKSVRALYEDSRPLPRRLRWTWAAEVRYGWATGAALLARVGRDGFDVLHARPALTRLDAPGLALRALLPL